MKYSLRNLLFQLISFSMIFFACQKDDEIIDHDNQLDEDMLQAIELVDEYLKTTKGRSDSEKVSITVLRYYKNKLWYQTYVDGVTKYEEVTESTITAVASPGESVFWYGGWGLEDLDEIDFDETSEQHLQKEADEIFYNRLWSIQIPSDLHEKTEYLKYDIVYQYNGNSGPVIRLDPKIRVKGGDGDEDGEPSN
ncbi:hypothetical protein [Ekhidna sp.]|uniref:hypothetical protein n=1 Tax=Ekhidna sp. TaxID=2608089 RepID=UPI003CCBCB78